MPKRGRGGKKGGNNRNAKKNKKKSAKNASGSSGSASSGGPSASSSHRNPSKMNPINSMASKSDMIANDHPSKDTLQLRGVDRQTQRAFQREMIDGATLAASIQNRLKQLENDQLRKKSEAIFKTPNGLLKRANLILQSLETDLKINLQAKIVPSELTNESINESREERYMNAVSQYMELITNSNGLFYQMRANESAMCVEAKSLADKNERLQQLCRALRSDNGSLQDQMKELTHKTKEWHEQIQKKLKSVARRNDELVNENNQLKDKLKQIMDYQRERNSNFEKYREHQSKLDEISEQEKNGLREEIRMYQEKLTDFNKKMTLVVQMNGNLKKKCSTYEDKIKDMGDTIMDSHKSLKSFTKMKDQIADQNRKLTKSMRDLMDRYKELTGVNQNLKGVLEKTQKKCQVLGNLSRKMQDKNRVLMRRVKTMERELKELRGEKETNDNGDDDDDNGKEAGVAVIDGEDSNQVKTDE